MVAKVVTSGAIAAQIKFGYARECRIPVSSRISIAFEEALAEHAAQ